MAAKRSIEIEKLLHWTYRDELIKRHSSSAEGIWDHIEEYGQRGGIDVGQSSAQRYPHFGVPHKDAETIEKAVSSLPNIVLDWVSSCEAIMGELSALLQSRDTLLVRSLRPSALITMHAKMGTRPDWREDQPKPHWIAAERGKIRPQVIGTCHSKDRYSFGSHCPLQWEPSPIAIAETRADYACWHRGLMILSETLVLDEHIALPPLAPERPWAGEREPARRIYLVGERQRDKLRLKPERDIAGPPEKKQRASKVRLVENSGIRRFEA